ncbi:hypothetical protein [Nitrogeniibacter aestuarii]|uniref:hypothetical protein n=1 Tax=Nitrogeniibacter aestuarii TaxID=2815343 RepID=UPI001D1293B5|nr:hypothetical protein [Nitrogeniibacter aestuarii]
MFDTPRLINGRTRSAIDNGAFDRQHPVGNDIAIRAAVARGGAEPVAVDAFTEQRRASVRRGPLHHRI